MFFLILVCTFYSTKKLIGEVDVDTKIDFMEYMEDESVYWMNPHHEPSAKTYMLESIRDDIYYQTN